MHEAAEAMLRGGPWPAPVLGGLDDLVLAKPRLLQDECQQAALHVNAQFRIGGHCALAAPWGGWGGVDEDAGTEPALNDVALLGECPGMAACDVGMQARGLGKGAQGPARRGPNHREKTPPILRIEKVPMKPRQRLGSFALHGIP